MRMQDKAKFAYNDWLASEAERLKHIAQQQAVAVLECDPDEVENVVPEPAKATVTFEVDGVSFLVKVDTKEDDEETVTLYARVNWQHHQIRNLSDLGRWLNYLAPSVVP